jgi:hypothetical protein
LLRELGRRLGAGVRVVVLVDPACDASALRRLARTAFGRHPFVRFVTCRDNVSGHE